MDLSFSLFKDMRVEPFLHFNETSIYNPLTDLTVNEGDARFNALAALNNGNTVSDELFQEMIKENWLVKNDIDILSRSRLKFVVLEGNSHCNQKCNFCPVSISSKPIHTMSLEFYEKIVLQLSTIETIEGLFMINYNEPTIDKYFVQRVEILKKYGIPVCINTNGTGLIKKTVDKILALGGVRYLSINLSTLDKKQYENERKYKMLDRIIKNLEYLKDLPLAQEMVIAVLGKGDDVHHQNLKEIEGKFENSLFKVQFFEVMDRAGNVSFGNKPERLLDQLKGCENMGSRPLQHLHVNAFGECVLCCEDYYEKYKVGDLNEETVEEVLSGKRMSQLRGMTYGLTEAPKDYICRKCIFARTCKEENL